MNKIYRLPHPSGYPIIVEHNPVVEVSFTVDAADFDDFVDIVGAGVFVYEEHQHQQEDPAENLVAYLKEWVEENRRDRE